MGYEVEVKYRCSDLRNLADLLQRNGAIQAGRHEYADLYFAHPGRDYAATDEALRLRRVDDENRITYKGPKRPGPTKTREEIELPLGVGREAFDAFATLLDRLGFRAVALVPKSRREFHITHSGRPLTVALDDAGPLGTFAEVEALAVDDSDLAAAQAAVLGLAASLGLTEVELRSYLRMMLERGVPNPDPA
jgi:adenylate cyclase, class 2